MKLSERAIFISFYEEMDVLCQRVLHEMNVEIPTFQISKNEKMEDVKERLEARLSEGVSLVICRGLVGAIIREIFPVTVLEVQQSSADILRILLPYQGKATRIGVLESAAFCRQVQEIAELLHLEMSYFPVKTMADFWTNCEKAEKMGVEVLIGGTWGKVYPSAVHIPYIAVEYSEKAVRSCLEDTLHINAGVILEGKTLKDVGDEVIEFIKAVANGQETAAERNGQGGVLGMYAFSRAF